MKKIQVKNHSLAVNVDKMRELTEEQSTAVTGGALFASSRCTVGTSAGSSITTMTSANYNYTLTTGW